MNDLKKQNLILKMIRDGQLPDLLYKYRAPSDYTKNIFKKEELWFSDPNDFNDPFDCKLDWDSVSLKSLDDLIKLGVDTKKIILENKQTKENLENIFSEQLIKIRDEVVSKIGVLCLSKSFENILMWSHYAESHKGLVIELNVNKDIDFFSIPVNVEYTEKYQLANYLENQNDAIKKLLKTKSLLWKYEEEVRVIKYKFNDEFSRAQKINPLCINRVLFGCAAETDFITGGASENGKNRTLRPGERA